MNGARLLTRTLRAAGVETIFSLSGNQIMPVYDAAIDDDLRIIHTRHEGGAVYMADGFAQASGRLGVAMVTAAPGFANALSAVYSARMNESPVLFLSGDSPVGEDGNAPFQELDQCAMAAPVTKASFRPRSPAELGAMLGEAIRVALSGRPGPVHVALPFDVLTAAAAEGDLPGDITPPVRELDNAAAVASALAGAERPLIVTGPMLNEGRGGGRAAALRAATGVPVVCLESPRGLRDPALGAFVEVMAQADLILGIGKVPDFTMGFARSPAVSAEATLLFIDPETESLDRAKALSGGRLALAAQADPRAAVDAILPLARMVERAAWCADVDSAMAYREDPSTAPGIHPRPLCAHLQAVLEAATDPVLVCDGGEFGQWAQALLHAPMRLTNGLSGAIGGGIGYAVGAKVARPGATVVLTMGDGTAGFTLAELDTAARADAPFLAVIGNDACWNAERHIQIRDYGADRAIGCDLDPATRYDGAAVALGCHGARVLKDSEIAPALSAALASGKPAVLDIAIASLAAPVFRRADLKPA